MKVRRVCGLRRSELQFHERLFHSLYVDGKHSCGNFSIGIIISEVNRTGGAIMRTKRSVVPYTALHYRRYNFTVNKYE